MILRTDELKTVASLIGQAVDTNDVSQVTETLELVTINNELKMNVTNKEYYVSVSLGATDDPNFNAAVKASLFLKLISQITTETVELNCKDTSLVVKGNGNYKIPLIFDNDKLLELPTIEIDNPETTMMVNKEVLLSIYNYNTKEISKGVFSRPVQKMYYVDESGCITFTTGACVNNFTLEKPVKLLLSSKLVKLFKLFTDDKIEMVVGNDKLTEEITQTKLRLKTPKVTLTAILTGNESMLNSVPVKAIRNRAESNYEYSVDVDKNQFVEAVNRLMLFNNGNLKSYATFTFDNNGVTVADINGENTETLYYKTPVNNLSNTYSLMLDLSELKVTLDSCSENILTFNFGNSQAIVIKRADVYNVIPEVREM